MHSKLIREAREHAQSLDRLLKELGALPQPGPTLEMPRVIGDNFRVCVSSEMTDRVRFDLAFQMAANGRRFAYRAVTPYGLLFCWYIGGPEETGRHTWWRKENDGLPGVDRLLAIADLGDKTHLTHEYPIVADEMPEPQAREFAWNWLNTDAVHDEEYDGGDLSEYKGWTVTTGDCFNHIGPHHGAILLVMPTMIWVGK